MAYSETLSLVVGDTLPELTLTLKDKNTAASGVALDEENSDTWAPIDITGATVALRIRQLGATSLVDTLICSVTDGVNGKCATDFGVTTFASAGQYEGEIEITFSGSIGKQTVYDLVKFKIRDDFD
jgi:hypothetical protein